MDTEHRAQPQRTRGGQGLDTEPSHRAQGYFLNDGVGKSSGKVNLGFCNLPRVLQFRLPSGWGPPFHIYRMSLRTTLHNGQGNVFSLTHQRKCPLLNTWTRAGVFYLHIYIYSSIGLITSAKLHRRKCLLLNNRVRTCRHVLCLGFSRTKCWKILEGILSEGRFYKPTPYIYIYGFISGMYI